MSCSFTLLRKLFRRQLCQLSVVWLIAFDHVSSYGALQTLSFINNHLVYSSFVYPFLGDKLVFNLPLDLSGMGSFSVSL